MANFEVDEIDPDGASLSGSWASLGNFNTLNTGLYIDVDGTTVFERPPGFWLQILMPTASTTTITIVAQGDPEFESGVVVSDITFTLSNKWEVFTLWLDPYKRQFLETSGPNIEIEDPNAVTEAIAFFMR